MTPGGLELQAKRLLKHPAVRGVIPVVFALAITGGGMTAIAGVHGLASRLHTAEHALAEPRPRVTVTQPAPASPLPASRPSKPSRSNSATLSPVLALRFNPGGVTVPGGSGAASAGSTDGSGGTGAGGSPSPQPSSPPPPQPSPVPTPPPSPHPGGCTVEVDLSMLKSCTTLALGG